MKRARIKPIANIPVTRRPAKRNEKHNDKKTDEINNIDQEKSVQTVQNVTRECNVKSVTDIKIQSLEQLKNCDQSDTSNCKSNKVNPVLVKPEQAETFVSRDQFSNVLEKGLMKVDEGSCQNESILPNPENSEKLHMCVPNPMELCQVFLQCNEMESTEKQNLLPVTAGNDSIENAVKKFKVGVNGELVIDQCEDLQANLNCKNDENQKSMVNERMITKPIIIDDTLYRSGFSHNYTRHAGSSNEMKTKKPLFRNELPNTSKKSLVEVDHGSSWDELILSYHASENASQKSNPDAFFPTVQQEREQHFEPPNNNRVTIHDVIHSKLYARFPKQICAICNGVGCTAEHKVLPQNERAPEEDIVQKVKVGPNGQLVIDEEEHFSENKRFSVESSEVPTFGDMGGYKKRSMGGWNSESSSKFLKALKVFGTDFDMMKSWFPDKSRYQLYRKFKKEEKKNGAVVDNILRNQNFDADAVQEGIDFSNQTRTETSTAETVNLQKQKEQRKKGKSKKRKISGLVLKSIEMSSTDEETESDCTIEEIKVHQNVITINDTCGNIVPHHTTQHLNTIRTSALVDNKLRYEEMSNILKEMKSKQKEKVRLTEA